MSTLREAAEKALKALGVATTPFPTDQQEVRSAMDALRAALSAPTEQEGWIPVAERLPDSGCVVLACYRNSAGNLRRIRAEWVAAKTQESGGDSNIGEYDEATDTYYDPQGWYERIDNWDDGFSAVGVSQGEVTHWMPLPDVPQAG